MRILWLGTYERDYPRTRVLVDGLRARGVDVVEVNTPVWAHVEHKASLRLPAALGLAARFVAGWVRLAAAQRHAGHVDLVVAGYPAQPDAVPARLVATLRRAPLLVDAMISFEDTLSGDRSTVGRIGGRVLYLVDRLMTAAGTVVMVDTAAHGAYFRRRLRVPARKVAIVPVGAEPAAFPPAPPPVGAPTALFYGKLAPLHGLETVVAAAREDGVPPVRIVGTGQLSEWLDGELMRHPNDRLEHVPWIPYAKLGQQVADAAICLGVFGTSEKAARVVPNKVYQAMAVGRPIITADTPGVREVLTDGVDALLVPAGDAPALAAALRRLAADPELRARLGTAARHRFTQIATPDAVAERFLAEVRRIVPGLR